MSKKPTQPLKATIWISGGRLNSPDGIIMFDGIIYHAWFLKHAPHVLNGAGLKDYDGHMGLPIKRVYNQMIYSASAGVYTQENETTEHIHKRPNFGNYPEYLAMEKGIIPDTMGIHRAYRNPQTIRIIKDGKIEFWCMGHANEIEEYLSLIVGVGKKNNIGYGLIIEYKVEESEADYSIYHPQYGLMRPLPMEYDFPPEINLNDYELISYCTAPPYYNPKNNRRCYIPNVENLHNRSV